MAEAEEVVQTEEGGNMKKVILLLLCLIVASYCWGQDSTIIKSEWSEDKNHVPLFRYSGWETCPDTLIVYQNFTVINLIALLDEYEEECADTIRASKFEDEYIIPFDGSELLKEMVSERQLEERGYKYKYRWVINKTYPIELEYVFIKEPSFRGFGQFLRRKSRCGKHSQEW